MKNFFYFLFTPIQKELFELSAQVGIFLSAISRCEKLAQEKIALESQLKQEIVEKESLLELKKENEQLRKALNINLEKEFKLELARFVGKDVSGDIFILNKGKGDGIEEGQVVITPEKVLIGKIVKVYENFSKVRVFTDSNFTFDVEIGENGIKGLAKGEGGFRAHIELLPKSQEIHVGDKVFTSILGGVFPPKILVGEIETIEKSDLEFYQKAKLKPALVVDQLDFLFVILNFK